jgi:hypothetical protein
MKQSIHSTSKAWILVSLLLAIFMVGCEDDSSTSSGEENTTAAAIGDACNHMINGPFDTVSAGGEIHGEISHKRWTLNLDTSSTPYAGTFELHAEEGDHDHAHEKVGASNSGETVEIGVFLSDSVNIVIKEGSDVVSAKDETVDISSCPEMKAYQIYEIEYEAEYSLEVSGSANKSVDIVFGPLVDEHAHEEGEDHHDEEGEDDHHDDE